MTLINDCSVALALVVGTALYVGYESSSVICIRVSLPCISTLMYDVELMIDHKLWLLRAYYLLCVCFLPGLNPHATSAYYANYALNHDPAKVWSHAV